MRRRDSVVKLRWLLAACVVLSVPTVSIAGGPAAPARTAPTGAATAAAPRHSGPEAPAAGAHHMGSGGAGGSPSRRIVPLVSRADRIVRGTVESAEPMGEGILTVARDKSGFEAPVRLSEPAQGRAVTPDSVPVAVYWMTFRVTATVKGASASPGSALTVEAYLPYSGPAWRPLQVGQHGLLLLDANGALAELDYPLLPVSPDAPVLPDTLSPLDAVGQYFLLSLRPDTAPAVLESCLDGALDLGIAQQATEALKALAASSDTAVQGIGLWGLMEIQDTEAVGRAASFLLADRSVAQTPGMVNSVGSAVSKLSDPSLVGAVLPLLSSPVQSVRQSAVDALRRMKAPAAVPALIDLAKRPDLYEQWSALIALCDILGIESPDALGPLEEYEKNPQPYRDWWARWWDTEGKAKYAASAAQ